MYEEFGLGGEVVVDDVVEQWDVDAPGGQVRHEQHATLLVAELGHADLTSGLIERAVRVTAANARLRQDLQHTSQIGRASCRERV